MFLSVFTQHSFPAKKSILSSYGGMSLTLSPPGPRYGIGQSGDHFNLSDYLIIFCSAFLYFRLTLPYLEESNLVDC